MQLHGENDIVVTLIKAELIGVMTISLVTVTTIIGVVMIQIVVVTIEITSTTVLVSWA